MKISDIPVFVKIQTGSVQEMLDFVLKIAFYEKQFLKIETHLKNGLYCDELYIVLKCK